MNFVCEHCGWVGTRFELEHQAGITECPQCDTTKFIRVNREVVPG